MILDVFNEANQKVLSYKLFRCWPSEYQTTAPARRGDGRRGDRDAEARDRVLGARPLGNGTDGDVGRAAASRRERRAVDACAGGADRAGRRARSGRGGPRGGRRTRTRSASRSRRATGELVSLTRRLAGEDLRLVADASTARCSTRPRWLREGLSSRAPRVAAAGTRRDPRADVRRPPRPAAGRRRGDGRAPATLHGRRRRSAGRRPPRSSSSTTRSRARSCSRAAAAASRSRSTPTSSSSRSRASATWPASSTARSMLLAGAYGWRLAEIEALPDARRRRLAALVSEAR